MNEKINEQEKIIANQDKEIKLLKERTTNLENKISFLYEKLITNENEKTVKLKQLIGRKCQLQLLYQMKRDGNSCSVFHEKVDNQGPTITLFETEDGYKFGGYTSKSFKIASNWIPDPDSFLFNFITLKKFPIKNKDHDAIFLGSKNEYGPEFFDILINSFNTSKGIIREEAYIDNFNDLKGGDYHFNNNDVLVYKVIFD